MPAKLTDSEIEIALRGLSGWNRTGNAISRKFTFPSFEAAIAFVNRVAKLAEEVDHHPDITINYRHVAMRLTTHSEGGLTRKDFDLARKIEAAAS
jgi:4a-hydroxytetrahydrobiopterin dehydratase